MFIFSFFFHIPTSKVTCNIFKTPRNRTKNVENSLSKCALETRVWLGEKYDRFEKKIMQTH